MLETHKSAKDTFYKRLKYVHTRTTIECLRQTVWVAFNEALDGILQRFYACTCYKFDGDFSLHVIIFFETYDVITKYFFSNLQRTSLVSVYV